jgi:hypothetical protein
LTKKKAILIGNGVTSQLIDDYKDINMIEKFKAATGNLYYEINSLLDPYRNLPNKDKKSIVELLKKQNIESHHYQRYFIQQNLFMELENENIVSLESLMKTAHLFHHIKDFSYAKITLVANKIYYNEGKKDIRSINCLVDKEKFKNYICSFDFVFTTNFDTILDDVYKNEVCHLHGGFNYKKITENSSISINRVEHELSPEKAHLVWGRNPEEKSNKSKGGLHFPISFPFSFGSSVLERYLKTLENGDFTELYIWGYSGLNDDHINSKIRNNNYLKRTYVYIDPNLLNCNSTLHEKELLFQGNKDSSVYFSSWDTIWNSLK